MNEENKFRFSITNILVLVSLALLFASCVYAVLYQYQVEKHVITELRGISIYILFCGYFMFDNKITLSIMLARVSFIAFIIAIILNKKLKIYLDIKLKIISIVVWSYFIYSIMLENFICNFLLANLK